MMVLLDTNALIYLGLGRLPIAPPGHERCISVICEIELLSWHGFTTEAESAARAMLSGFRMLGISRDVRDETVRIRRDHKLKVPDAIIAATSIVEGALLWTYDMQFDKVNGLQLHRPPILEQS